jgi:hypothetical protein
MGGQDQGGGTVHGRGEQFEQLEGSLTDGGSLPGHLDEDRSFGAGREQQNPGEPGRAAQESEGGQVSGGIESDAPDGDAGPSGERSGYGNTPPR